ncbi:VOC family protein [Actinocrispum sp. NPDC049592]|uniref:VOC family protein n=1 Tax=Actinocrispum sp. NPDC049592 TaxID=3154835 RepID=UPI0034434B8A
MPLGHLGLNVSSLPRAKAFYDVLMPMLEYEPFFSADTEFSYRPADGKPGTYVFFYGEPMTGEYSRTLPGLQHLAFIVRTRDAVHEVYTRALDLGAESEIEPREFPEYHPGYYAAFVKDVNGFTLEVVCHKA